MRGITVFKKGANPGWEVGTSDCDTECLHIPMSVRLAAVLERFGVNELIRTFLAENTCVSRKGSVPVLRNQFSVRNFAQSWAELSFAVA